MFEAVLHKPPLREALARARDFCSQPHDPPMTRSEVFDIYRQARALGGTIIFRCYFKNHEGGIHVG